MNSNLEYESHKNKGMYETSHHSDVMSKPDIASVMTAFKENLDYNYYKRVFAGLYFWLMC